MDVNKDYLSSSKRQILRVFWEVLEGGVGGRSFADLAGELDLSDSALLKELHNLTEAGYVERRSSTRFWAVSPFFLEQFAKVIESLGLEVK